MCWDPKACRFPAMKHMAADIQAEYHHFANRFDV
jgi:hypothetical protein